MPKCHALINSLQLDTDLRFRPCGTFLRDEYTVDHGAVSWVEYVNSDFYKNVRNIQENGWHPNCESCRIDEELGRHSKRTGINEELSGAEGQLEYMDLSISNQCNLTCKMCSPAASTKWATLMPANPKLEKYYQLISTDERTIDSVLSTVDFSNVKKIVLKGGEPFFGSNFDVVLEKIKSTRALEDIEIYIITNTTFFPKQNIEDLKKFKKLEIMMSIDGLDDLCNYIRTGASWDRVSKVAVQWIDLYNNSTNMELTVGFTIQALNLHEYRRVKKWADDNNIDFYGNLLKEPKQLSIYSLPQQYVDDLKSQGLLEDEILEQILTGQQYPEADMFELIELQDQSMNTSLAETIPALYAYKHR